MTDTIYSDEELSKLDVELEAIFAKRGLPKLVTPTRDNIQILRKGYDRVTKRYTDSPFAKSLLGASFDNPTWDEVDRQIPTRDGRLIDVRLYIPKAIPSGGAPVIMQFHGGGWFMGSLSTDDLICRLYCSTFNALVINVGYSLIPEVTVETAARDCYDAVRWASANAGSFGGSCLKGFITAGNSGGSTYATMACHWARDDEMHPPVTGAHLMCPILSDELSHDGADTGNTIYDHKTEYRSWEQNRNAPLMGDKMRIAIRDLCGDRPADAPGVSPFHLPSRKDLPPTYLVACGLDPWRDGVILYKKELDRAKVPTKLEMYPGMPHCWWTTFPQISMTRVWAKRSLEGIQWLLDQLNAKSSESKL